MAMYYYARKLQKSTRKNKTLPQTPVVSNGSIPSTFPQPPNGFHHSHNSNSCFENFKELKNTIDDDDDDSDQPSTSALAANGFDNHSDNDSLIFNGPTLMSGTLEALIEQLVPTETNFPDRSYIFAFLLSSRLFIQPHDLMRRIFQCVIEYAPTEEEIRAVPHLVKLLGEWTALFPYDFRDEKMMAHIRTTAQCCVAYDENVQEDVSLILTELLSQLTALEKYEECLHRINTEASIGEPIAAPSVLTVCPHPNILAEQLTQVELERLSHIGPEEFVQLFSTDSSPEENRCIEPKRTRNLESYSEWSQRLGYYTASEICKVSKKKTRVKVVGYWIEVARECYNIGNFNSLMAILTGLNLPPVARLKKTWSKINCEQLNVLEEHLDTASDFSSYRVTLKAALWQSADPATERKMVVVPFFSLLMKDMQSVYEGCGSRLPNGHLKFEKFCQFAKHVTEVIAWQQMSCPFNRMQVIFNSVQTSPIFMEEELLIASYDCEAPENSQEKEQAKQLRLKYTNTPTTMMCKAVSENGTDSSLSSATLNL